MTDSESKVTKEARAKERFHDRALSILLVAIWIVAALMVYRSDTEIPAMMLVIGTVFFIMLVPAMIELVKVIDRRVKIQLGLIEPVDE